MSSKAPQEEFEVVSHVNWAASSNDSPLDWTASPTAFPPIPQPRNSTKTGHRSDMNIMAGSSPKSKFIPHVSVSATSDTECSCAPCVKTRKSCRKCQLKTAENMSLLKKLKGYENKHVAKQDRNTTFIFTFITFAFCFWISTVAFSANQTCMVVSWIALAPVSSLQICGV
jgi:hypothetical protein